MLVYHETSGVHTYAELENPFSSPIPGLPGWYAARAQPACVLPEKGRQGRAEHHFGAAGTKFFLGGHVLVHCPLFFL